MLIGLSALKSGSKSSTTVLNAWFGDEQQHAPARHSSDSLVSVHIHKSLRSMGHHSRVPELPRFAKHVVPSSEPQEATPYQILTSILNPHSRSSQWLAQFGLLNKFVAQDCFVDISMAADGGFNASLRSTDGYRRTVVCRRDGTSSQRITGPHGEEIVRFNSNGDPVHLSEVKRENTLALAAV